MLAHDADAFTEFFDGFFPRLYRFARARLGEDRDTLKEIVHVTLARPRCSRGSARYAATKSAITWIASRASAST
jgi:DNA-directed RNA polymerase specialized sigma24 family protein